jgi:hypothetical protein
VPLFRKSLLQEIGKRNVDDALPLGGIHVWCHGYDIFGIVVFDGNQVSKFAIECLFFRNQVCNLDIDNLVALAKFYGVSIDEIIVIKTETTDSLPLCEPNQQYGIAQETLEFIEHNASPKTKEALERYYGISF